MLETPLVWIVVLNCSGLKDTIECLNSVQSISYPNYRICVVDNGSPVNEVSAIVHGYPDVHIIKNSTNMGFSAACNQGANYGIQQGAEYILFLNNDTIVDCGFLDKLVASYSTGQNLGIIGSKIYYYRNKNVIWSCGGLFSYIDGPFVNIGQCEVDGEQYSSFTYTDYVTACCALVRSDVFTKTGGFNEDYFAYVEDVELCVRIREMGYTVAVEPESIIWHKISMTTGGDCNPTKEYYKVRNTLLFLRKGFFKEAQFKYWWCVTKKYFVECLYLLKHRQYKVFSSVVRGIGDGLLKQT